MYVTTLINCAYLKQEEITKKDSDKVLCSLEVTLCSLDKICDVGDLEILWRSLKE